MILLPIQMPVQRCLLGSSLQPRIGQAEEGRGEGERVHWGRGVVPYICNVAIR